MIMEASAVCKKTKKTKQNAKKIIEVPSCQTGSGELCAVSSTHLRERLKDEADGHHH